MAQDATTPTLPSNKTIKIEERKENSIKISWNKATDPGGTPQNQLKYIARFKKTTEPYFNTSDAVILTDATTHTFTGLDANTMYDISVFVRNLADKTAQYTQRTASTDITKPDISDKTITTKVTQSSITLTWEKATDNVTAANKLEYSLVHRKSTAAWTSVPLVDASTYTLNGLTPGTSYDFVLQVHDEAGNTAGYTSINNVLTAEDPVEIVKMKTKITGQLQLSASWSGSGEVLVSGTTVTEMKNNNMTYVNTDGEVTISAPGTVKFESLTITDQKLTVLDVSKCKDLTSLRCSGNALTTLDINGCTKLDILYAQGQVITVVSGSGGNYRAPVYYKNTSGVVEEIEVNAKMYKLNDFLPMPSSGNELEFTTSKTITNSVPLSGTIILEGYTGVVNPTEVNINPTEFSVEAGSTETVFAIVMPAGSTNKNVTWTSSDPAIATVTYSDDGASATVKGIFPGTATITAETHNGIKQTCPVTVTDTTGPKASDKEIRITGTTHNSISISWDAATDNAYPHSQLQYYVCCEDPAGIMGCSGALTGATSYTITGLKANNGYNIELEVYDPQNNVSEFGYGYNPTTAKTDPEPVTIIPVSSVKLDYTELTLKQGGMAELFETVLPDDAADKSVEWSSDMTSVATVSKKGVVTAVAPGIAIITVTTNSGDLTADCIVTVTSDDTGLDNIKGLSLSAYPNPTVGSITVTGLTPGTTLKLYNTIGALVTTYTVNDEKMVINLSSVSSGLYYLIAEKEVIKIIKK